MNIEDNVVHTRLKIHLFGPTSRAKGLYVLERLREGTAKLVEARLYGPPGCFSLGIDFAPADEYSAHHLALAGTVPANPGPCHLSHTFYTLSLSTNYFCGEKSKLHTISTGSVKAELISRGLSKLAHVVSAH
ncbi:hypothetical protein RRG08_064969 [Elysia crispata]|uniref:Uncharacterized protein n=1 Tax=Elysia crispata TaxID=231223 RepID=A0AAE0YAT5_9GAST|nr:hypothetical protein RRG08_064969 [Elysia crispata]